jgi:hypothetical protein
VCLLGGAGGCSKWGCQTLANFCNAMSRSCSSPYKMIGGDGGFKGLVVVVSSVMTSKSPRG